MARITDPADGERLWGYPPFGFALLALGASYLLVARMSGVPKVTAAVAMVRTRLGRD